jgi:ribosomal protein S18 acetylase RimI-like enzyme
VLRAAGPFREEEITTALWVFDQSSRPEEGYFQLGAFCEGRLLGWVCYGPTPMTDGCWHLYWIAVDARQQRRGVARSLLEAVLQHAVQQGVRLLSLEASGAPASAAARAFYAALGFRAEARVHDYYRPGDDLVLFVRRFGGRDAPR